MSDVKALRAEFSELSWGAVDAAIDAITLLLEHPERSH